MKEPWTEQEEWTLFLLHKLYGNKWAILTRLLKGRTDNTIKNHWNSIMRKKMGFYEKKLKESRGKVPNNASTLEGFLIQEINQGKFDNKSNKKGRKKNLNLFFEKNMLKQFLHQQEDS